jgi:hypothetical protein
MPIRLAQVVPRLLAALEMLAAIQLLAAFALQKAVVVALQ